MRYLAAVSLLTAACSAGRPAPEPDAARQVENALQHYTRTIIAGPPESTVVLFTPDGQMLQPGRAPLTGRQAILDFLNPLWAAYTVVEAWTESDTVEVFGATALQWARYRQSAGPKGGAPASYGGRLVIEWRRGPDGAWRIRRILAQPDPPRARQ
jgi:uncharacterized protein (TIGR02246 family)